MHTFRSAVHDVASNDAAARLAVPVLPFGLLVLLALTTSPWHPDERVHASVAALASRMVASGWTIRCAYPRNYLLWHRDRSQSESCLPLLVLPRVFGNVTDLEINVFLATELFAAEHRVRSPVSPLDTAALDAFCKKLISADSGLAIRSRQLACLKAARAVANAIVRL
jgi:hypothetical protein